VRDVFDFYRRDPTRKHAPPSTDAYRRVVTMVEAVFGPGLPVAGLDRTACRHLLEVLSWTPANSARRLPGLSLGQAVALTRNGGLRKRLEPITVNAYMARLGGLLNIAVAEGLIDRNPARGLKLPDPVRPSGRRRPFSLAQLQAIFDAPLYRGCVNDSFGFARPCRAHPRRGRFWAPLISLYAGLRLNEALQLDVADIQAFDGVDCFVVTASSAHGGDDKRVKTGLSERIVPIHSALKAMGLVAYAERQRARGEVKLFPELPRSRHSGIYSGPFSKWFRTFLIHCGASQARTSFHSFRHNFRDALRRLWITMVRSAAGRGG
jgi:integrase